MHIYIDDLFDGFDELGLEFDRISARLFGSSRVEMSPFAKNKVSNTSEHTRVVTRQQQQQHY